MSRPIPTQRPTVRRAENPISHEIETVILDSVQTDFELICHFIEGRMIRHDNGNARRLGQKLAEWLRHWEGAK